MEKKLNISYIIIIVLLAFIVIREVFKKDPEPITKYEVIQGRIINEDSLRKVIYKERDLKLDLELIQKEKEITKIKNEINKLHGKYKVIRISPDSLPYF